MEEVARRAAAAEGLDVTVIGSGRARQGDPYRFIHAGCINREVFEKFPKIPYARDHYAWEELSFAPALIRRYAPRHFDVTVTCGYPYSNWILRRGRKGARRPAHVFITQNGDWMVRSDNWEFKHFGCDGLICTNPEFYERHKERYPCALIPNGVDVARFTSPPDYRPGSGDRASFSLPHNIPMILVVAALIPSKRVVEAIRCTAGIRDVCLVVAGDGEQRQEVDSLGKQLMGDRFKRLFLGREQMPELYRCANVLLHMSQDEPFGNIYIEALASGIPVVAHDRPVTRWIVEDQANLVDTADFEAVVRALQVAIEDSSPQRASARRQLARRRFSWEAVASQYCTFFHEIHRLTTPNALPAAGPSA